MRVSTTRGYARTGQVAGAQPAVFADELQHSLDVGCNCTHDTEPCSVWLTPVCSNYSSIANDKRNEGRQAGIPAPVRQPAGFSDSQPDVSRQPGSADLLLPRDPGCGLLKAWRVEAGDRRSGLVRSAAELCGPRRVSVARRRRRQSSTRPCGVRAFSPSGAASRRRRRAPAATSASPAAAAAPPSAR